MKHIFGFYEKLKRHLPVLIQKFDVEKKFMYFISRDYDEQNTLSILNIVTFISIVKVKQNKYILYLSKSNLFLSI